MCSTVNWEHVQLAPPHQITLQYSCSPVLISCEENTAPGGTGSFLTCIKFKAAVSQFSIHLGAALVQLKRLDMRIKEMVRNSYFNH